MQNRLRAGWFIGAAALLFFISGMLPARARASDNASVEQHVRDQYGGTTLILRNFYSGQKLAYDSSGKVSETAPSGDWTVDGVVQVDKVRLSNHRLDIQAKRLHLGWAGAGGFSPVDDPKDKRSKEESRALRVEAELTSANPTAEQADALLSEIFLTSQDHFADFVPDYWKPCLLAAITGKDAKHYSRCRLSPEFLAIPGVAPPSEQGREPAPPAEMKPGGEVFRVVRGNGVSYPKIVNNASPEFSPEARQAKYEGVVTLTFVVDERGRTRDIRIVSPLGMGLDQEAVETLAKWSFNPGTKDGKPAAVEMNTEMDFHLY